MKFSLCSILCIIFINACTDKLFAQSHQDTSIHLQDAIHLAESQYHQLQSIKLEADASAKYVDVIKYSKVPNIDISYQAGFATANNLTGMFYLNGLLPISGPSSSSNRLTPVAGSAVSALMNWQAGTFGQRDAQINLSITEAKSKIAEWKQTLFQHKINVINTYLEVLLVMDRIKIHQQNIDRVNVILNQSKVLVDHGIKPGVDTALFLSERSKATVGLLKEYQQLQINQYQLGHLIGINGMAIPADSIFITELPEDTADHSTSLDLNPMTIYMQSKVEWNKSKESLLKKSSLPKLNFWGTTYARASGFQSNGEIKELNGFALNRINYGVGIQLIYPLLKYGEVKKQLEQQQLITQASEQTAEQTMSTLTLQDHIAETTLNNSITIAHAIYDQLKSSQYAYRAMETRYHTGLVNYSDLIQTQFNLFKAELDLKASYGDVWKALLLVSAVQGDEHIFLNAVH